ncbi:hypothetical protein Gohar_009808 [Gossypium harknessii]|uniref:Translocase of chloroplast 159/132 membrane anchor domain-containing protein n=1 Tax=Gossypium harknessii TaxID=34285 RepID=A0A7J9GP03_9ROSI|nr:hypothetical protein [Gossypium harknessii]
MFVAQRSHVVQQAIRQAAGDMHLMNPVSLAENHSACRTNRAGQRVLPNGQVWKPHLLLFSFASKILAEANSVLKLQETPSGKTRTRPPPLPFLLSCLLQSRPQAGRGQSFMVKHKYPVSFSGQITKDKKDTNIQTELASSLKHGSGKATSLAFDMETVGNDMYYTLCGETRFINFFNKATTGLSVTLLDDVLEAQWKDKDYLLNNSLSTLGVSIMDWHGDHVIGCNVQSHVRIGRSTNVIAQADLNNRGTGQVSIRISSSEQIQLALVALLPLMKKLIGYPQRMLYGPL